MKKRLILLVIVIFLIAGAFATNPTKDNYTGWIIEECNRNSSDFIQVGLMQLIGPTLVDMYTYTKNYVVFTVFTTSFPDSNDIVVVGVFHNFFIISQ